MFVVADRGQGWEIVNPPVDDDVESTTTVLGDLLVRLVGGFSASARRLFRVGRVTERFVGKEVDNSILILRVLGQAPPEIYAEYLYFWLTSPLFENHVDIHHRGGTTPRISRKDVMNFEFPLTDISDQLALIRAMETQHNATNNLIRHLTRSRDLVDQHREHFIEQAAADIMRYTR